MSNTEIIKYCNDLETDDFIASNCGCYIGISQGIEKLEQMDAEKQKYLDAIVKFNQDVAEWENRRNEEAKKLQNESKITGGCSLRNCWSKIRRKECEELGYDRGDCDKTKCSIIGASKLKCTYSPTQIEDKLHQKFHKTTASNILDVHPILRQNQVYSPHIDGSKIGLITNQSAYKSMTVTGEAVDYILPMPELGEVNFNTNCCSNNVACDGCDEAQFAGVLQNCQIRINGYDDEMGRTDMTNDTTLDANANSAGNLVSATTETTSLGVKFYILLGLGILAAILLFIAFVYFVGVRGVERDGESIDAGGEF